MSSKIVSINWREVLAPVFVRQIEEELERRYLDGFRAGEQRQISKTGIKASMVEGKKKARVGRYDQDVVVSRAIQIRRSEGLSCPAIADRLGMPGATLQGYLRRAGIKLSQISSSAYRSGKGGRDRAAIVNRAVELKKANPSRTCRQIAGIIGIPAGTLSAYLHFAGVRLGEINSCGFTTDESRQINEAIAAGRMTRVGSGLAKGALRWRQPSSLVEEML